jgi:hypothetical protein
MILRMTPRITRLQAATRAAREAKICQCSAIRPVPPFVFFLALDAPDGVRQGLQAAGLDGVAAVAADSTGAGSRPLRVRSRRFPPRKDLPVGGEVRLQGRLPEKFVVCLGLVEDVHYLAETPLIFSKVR